MLKFEHNESERRAKRKSTICNRGQHIQSSLSHRYGPCLRTFSEITMESDSIPS